MTTCITTKAAMRETISAVARSGSRVALVPTMGALHEGHLSLVRAARERADVVVVSVFVNPTQFGPGEDFERYPRTLEADLKVLEAAGADLVFAPSVDEMYGEGSGVVVEPGDLATLWEGESRPGHFAGVATVVTKLLCVVRPHVACFGEKDFQQCRVVESVVAELDLGVEIVVCPIVRDSDGLALSSRNRYLSADERERALSLSRALSAAAEQIAAGERDARLVSERMRTFITEAGLTVDYAVVVDELTLEPLAFVSPSARGLIAARVGTTRLIDNGHLGLAV